MRHPRRWERGDFTELRPLSFCGWPGETERPSSFLWEPMDFAAPGGQPQTAQLYYRTGWTAVIFWNRDIYFVDATLTFDGMIELLRERFANKFYLQAPVSRDYVD